MTDGGAEQLPANDDLLQSLGCSGHVLVADVAGTADQQDNQGVVPLLWCL